MGHKYVKEEDTFSTLQNGTVPKPTAQEVSDHKFLRSDGTWQLGSGGGATELNDLNDVLLTSLANGQLLKYISADGVFKNVNFADLLNGDSAYTKQDKNSGLRLVTKFIGNNPNGTTSLQYFPVVKFTGGWQDLSGIIIARSGICVGTHMVNASRATHFSGVSKLIYQSGLAIPAFSYNTSTYILSIGLTGNEYGFFIGATNGELQ